MIRLFQMNIGYELSYRMNNKLKIIASIIPLLYKQSTAKLIYINLS